MPRPDSPSPGKTRLSLYLRHSLWSPRKRPRSKGGEPEREPVEPDKPRHLSGGAAAALEFDD